MLVGRRPGRARRRRPRAARLRPSSPSCTATGSVGEDRGDLYDGPRDERRADGVGVAGLGYWGPNLARNFDELGRESRWICDRTTRSRAVRLALPDARVTADLDELLADDELEAVVIATPVPTHYPLAKRALEAGKHVLVEKPPAMHGDEMEELVAIAEERDLTLMPGHLLLYHPGVRKLKELIDSGELGDCSASRQPPEPRHRPRNENALWSLGVHDLSVILYLLDEDPVEAGRARARLPHRGRRGRRLLLPALPLREDRAHAPVVARPAQDAQLTVVGDQRWPSSTTWSPSAR